jgi:hypothetical protein
MEGPVDWVSLQRYPRPARCPQRMTTEERYSAGSATHNSHNASSALPDRLATSQRCEGKPDLTV